MDGRAEDRPALALHHGHGGVEEPGEDLLAHGLGGARGRAGEDRDLVVAVIAEDRAGRAEPVLAEGEAEPGRVEAGRRNRARASGPGPTFW